MTNLLAFYNEMTGIVAPGRVVDGSYLDFSQVFRMSFRIFVAKLRRYELDGTATRVKADCTTGFKKVVVLSGCVSGLKCKYQPK